MIPAGVLGSARVAPSGPAVIASDTFTRANSTTTLGTTEVGAQAWQVSSGVWGINANKAYRVSGASSVRPTAYIEAGSVDMDVTATVSAGEGSQYLALVARWESVADTYQLVLNETNSIELTRRDAGTNTRLFIRTFGTAVTGGTLRLTCKEEGGSTRLTVYFDGIEEWTGLDSTVGRPAGTKAGLLQLVVSGTGPGRFDDFTLSSI